MDLRQYFDRVVLINLKRRPDRLTHAKQVLELSQWPFKPPVVMEAVDGTIASKPLHWKSSPGAWGCLRSHQQALQSAILDGAQSILVLEDDVCFGDDFKEKVEEFLQIVPNDWDQLMIGGQHVNLTGKPPALIKPGVYRCADCERTHCYAVRGNYMRKLVERWSGGGKYNGGVHCDWIMGRDPELQSAHKVYAPERFLAGQESFLSDVDSLQPLRRFWNPPAPDAPVINLHAPAQVVADLREYGLYLGRDYDPVRGQDQRLARVFAATVDNHAKRVRRLAIWIHSTQWEIAATPALTCAIHHPEANPELVKAASLWPVHEIHALSVGEAIEQMRQIPELRGKYLPRILRR